MDKAKEAMKPAAKKNQAALKVSISVSHPVQNIPKAYNLDLDDCSLSYYAHCPLKFSLSLTVCTLV